VLDVRVLHRRYRRAGPVVERQRRDCVAARSVVGVGKAGMVSTEFDGDPAVGIGRHRRVEIVVGLHRDQLNG
jgi:hypothetical protein